MTTDGETYSIGDGRVEHLSMDQVDLDDTTYRFRVELQFQDLEDSLSSEGLQIPIIVRPREDPDRGEIMQIVSGHRRANAARALGWSTIAAIVRPELNDDDALRVSILENEQRKSYTDLDRALVIRRYKESGRSSIDIERLMGLKKRQANNIRQLLDCPKGVQKAVIDTEHRLTMSHALELYRVLRQSPELPIDSWVERVHAEEISVRDLKALLQQLDHPQEGQGAEGHDGTVDRRVVQPDYPRVVRPIDLGGLVIDADSIQPESLAPEDMDNTIVWLEGMLERLRGARGQSNTPSVTDVRGSASA